MTRHVDSQWTTGDCAHCHTAFTWPITHPMSGGSRRRAAYGLLAQCGDFLDDFDRRHADLVAAEVMQACYDAEYDEEDMDKLVALALLHDIGFVPQLAHGVLNWSLLGISGSVFLEGLGVDEDIVEALSFVHLPDVLTRKSPDVPVAARIVRMACEAHAPQQRFVSSPCDSGTEEEQKRWTFTLRSARVLGG